MGEFALLAFVMLMVSYEELEEENNYEL